MKKIIVFTALFTTSLFGQWNLKWYSNATGIVNISGFVNFQKSGSNWNTRYYLIDSLKIQVMQSTFSNSPQYTYNFSAAEKLAQAQVYSIGLDLTGDNITEFYILGYVGTSTNYRQTMKIFDITTGNTVFELGALNYSYSYPTFEDIDNNSFYDCIVYKYNYPDFSSFLTEVYNTNIPVLALNESPEITPLKFTLNQNFPNPFNSSTKISFQLDKSSRVKINIFDTKGELIKILFEGEKKSGNHELLWDGVSSNGLKVPSGMYMYEVIAGASSQSRKMVLIK